MRSNSIRRDSKHTNLSPFSNSRITTEKNKLREKHKTLSSRKSILSIRGREISPNKNNVFQIDYDNKDYFQSRYFDLANKPLHNEEPEKPVPVKAKLEEDLSINSSEFSNSPIKIMDDIKPPFRIKKKERNTESRMKVKHNLVLTPEMKNKNTFDKEINKQSSRIREIKEKFRFKKSFRKLDNSINKIKTSTHFWRKRSLNKEKQKIATERKVRENVLLNSALFLRNKNSMEEALGGNENQLYKK
mmetsp:Transcript_25422/g.22578  ORF Transcript_25422/g.22578 Transcript_25422/m.22578 type:complete len:245 (-) Transcript_25422:214-948(-)